jgi:hypothetical protein
MSCLLFFATAEVLDARDAGECQVFVSCFNEVNTIRGGYLTQIMKPFFCCCRGIADCMWCMQY